MKKAFNIILIAVFSFVNAFSFIGCRETAAQPEEVRACWVSSVGNLDYPSKMGLSVPDLKSEINSIVSNCKRIGLNTIFFQVRPMGDALYRSEIFPWSVYISGTQGKAPKDGFDPLAYFLEKAHGAGLKLHAWINPYRIGAGENVWDKLSKDNPAVLHREYTVTCTSGVYYNPGHPKARELILNGVAELVRNYKIDGIHFDDYFYPYNMDGFDDSRVYKEYGNGLSLADFRRDSVNQLVESAYKLVKNYSDTAQFGISPFGIWANKSVDPAGSETCGMSSYSAIYSDSKKWVEQGWVDYICPQIYWSVENQVAPYDVLVDWWSALCNKNNVDLYVGIALYKVGGEEEGWDSGSVIGEQLNYACKKSSYAGHCFFRYGLLEENVLGALDSICAYYKESFFQSPEMELELEPIELEEAESFEITSPENGAVLEENAVSVTGIAPLGKGVTVNNVVATVNSKGLFAAHVPLSAGVNHVKVTVGNYLKTIRVTYQPKTKKKLTKLDLSTAYPSGTVHHGSGDVIRFEVDGPSGAKVVLQNDLVSIYLVEEENQPGHYAADWSVPSFPVADKQVLNHFSYETTVNGVAVKEKSDLTLNLYSSGYMKPYYLSQDGYVFDQSSGGSQMDHEPLPKGMAVTGIGEEGGRVQLQSGYWIEKSLLAEEPVIKADVSNYDYAVVTVASKNPFEYMAKSDPSGLQLDLSLGRMEKLEWATDTEDLFVNVNRYSVKSALSIVSRSGKVLAGYEVFPQKNCLTVYLRFHTNSLAGKNIMLDAGHGGDDMGAQGAGGIFYPAESQMNLALTAALKEKLEAAGATVYLTRNDDYFVSLAERVESSVAAAPDLFISLHHNSVNQTEDFNKASGGLVLFSEPLSEPLAEVLAGKLWDGVGEAAISKRQSLYVCRQIRCPAVLIEAGFICNPVEYEMLCRKDIMQRIAQNIVNGLNEYFVTVCS